MRRDRIPLELIAPMMGHADTKMLERVYGKLSTAELTALVTGTNVAQTNAHQLDSSDSSDSAGKKKPRKTKGMVPREGLEPSRPKRARDFKSLPEQLPQPRKYKRKRDYAPAAGTDVAQQRAAGGGVVIVLPRTRGRGGR